MAVARPSETTEITELRAFWTLAVTRMRPIGGTAMAEATPRIMITSRISTSVKPSLRSQRVNAYETACQEPNERFFGAISVVQLGRTAGEFGGTCC